jgi:hypothetical protein
MSMSSDHSILLKSTSVIHLMVTHERILSFLGEIHTDTETYLQKQLHIHIHIHVNALWLKSHEPNV